MRKIRKGDIFLVDLNPVIGHEQGGFRPVVVVQNNIANDILNTVMVAPLTSNPKAAGYLLTAQIDAKNSGLYRDSIALLFQVRTIDKRRLVKRLGRVSNRCYAGMYYSIQKLEILNSKF